MDVLTILISIFVFGIIILFHEFGHFIVAKKSGILVEEFAIGMGPKFISKKIGETVYSIRVFPLGGFCKMLGQDSALDDNRSFTNKSVGIRIAVIIAGPLMNLLLAYIIIAWSISSSGFLTTTVNKVLPDSAAQEIGLQAGDKIISLDGQRIHIKEEIDTIIQQTKDSPIKIVFKRDRTNITKLVTPKFNGERWLIGFEPKIGENNIINVLVQSFWQLLFIMKQVIIGVIKILTFQVEKEQVAGPLGVMGIIGQAYQEGMKASLYIAIQYLLSITAIISINLGIMNLLPIPALDGGRLVFLFLEALRGKPVDVEKEGMIHFIGFALLMTLMVVVLFNDISRVFTH